MKVVKKNVYYCDFCKKKGMSGSHISVDEKHCTANPDRSCRMCEGRDIREVVDKYKKYFYIRTISSKNVFDDAVIQVVYLTKFTLQDLKNELEYECPNCLLTLIRCLGLNRYYFKGVFKFDYKEMLGDWWQEHNDRAREEAERETYEVY